MHASTRPDATRSRGRWKLYAVIAICAAPAIASYLVYYFVRPDARSNYGTLIEPQRPMPALHLKALDGRGVDAASLRGKWLMVMVAGGDCPRVCQDRLYHLRQVRLTAGKDRDRVVRVWLIPDDAPLSTMLMREYDGTAMLRADPKEIAPWLGGGAAASRAADYTDHIYVVDPLGNLMMRFPVDADPNKTKRDLAKLLRASSVG
ncbi:MAG: SCO family protein [Burkholderiaceae bacterium]